MQRVPLESLCKYTRKCTKKDLGIARGFEHKWKIPVLVQNVSRLMAMSCEVFSDFFLDIPHYL